MKSILFCIYLVLNISSALAQQTNADEVCFIQDSALIPIRSGIPISDIIVRKKSNVQPLPVVLFYTTFYQGSGDAILGKRFADKDYVGVVAYNRGIRTDREERQPPTLALV